MTATDVTLTDIQNARQRIAHAVGDGAGHLAQGGEGGHLAQIRLLPLDDPRAARHGRDRHVPAALVAAVAHEAIAELGEAVLESGVL